MNGYQWQGFQQQPVGYGNGMYYQPRVNYQQAVGQQLFDIGYQPRSGGFADWKPDPDITAPSAQGFGLNLGTVNAFGNAMQGIGAGVGAWAGLKQVDLAKDTLNFQKETFAKNWANQVALTNTALRDRQAARASASSYAKPVDEYMKENEVK